MSTDQFYLKTVMLYSTFKQWYSQDDDKMSTKRFYNISNNQVSVSIFKIGKIFIFIYFVGMEEIW